MKGLLSEKVNRANYLKSVEYIAAIDVGNPPVPLELIFSFIIHALIPLSAAADVPI